MAKRVQHPPELFIAKLRRPGQYACRKKHEGMLAFGGQGAEKLRDENARVKRLLAGAELDKDSLRFIAEGKI